MMRVEPVTLSGRLVRLEQMRLEHAPELFEASRDPGIWTYKIVKQPESVAEMEQLIVETLQQQSSGGCLPFAIISQEHGGAIGETRYHSFAPRDRGLEIGWTWLTPVVQRTGVNTECKYLLLRCAFETWGAVRVQFRTHHLNTNSQRAIERLGATREGTLRSTTLMPDGSYSNRVYFSILAGEWPAVRARLEAMMERR